MSALLALLLAAAPYRAHGTEPFWGVTIAGNRVAYESGDGPGVVVAVRPRTTRAGRIYSSRRMTVEIRRARCNDGMGDRYYADTVLVRFGRASRALEGCGGAVLRPTTLNDTAWGIVAIDGRPIARADNYQLDFAEGRLHGQAGCNRFAGPYREARGTLAAGPIVATRMACPEPRMRHERRVLALLAGSVRFAYRDGETLVLTGNGGTMRLRRLS